MYERRIESQQDARFDLRETHGEKACHHASEVRCEASVTISFSVAPKRVITRDPRYILS